MGGGPGGSWAEEERWSRMGSSGETGNESVSGCVEGEREPIIINVTLWNTNMSHTILWNVFESCGVFFFSF